MNWQLVCLAAIAVATVVMTTIQVVLLLKVARLARQAADAAEELRREVRPLMAKAHRIADDAGRATTLALAQVERVDRILTTTAERVDEVVGALHDAIVVPLRQGSVLMSAFRAAVTWFGRAQRSGPASREDEDALFVG